ncbi:hypothetical protein [Streptomyces qinglanensis]|uniref:Uncharacterized protein n=1 Tax=Streptomyces qinglanensis TaxID=943816 RepID=A0A1H9SA42_9ACTN|nr:hypothetical protein [Streptomyces qinglanensis]SER81049.1 hypothetical protein SAMN05421870_104337 [Streptomyces qinglanensis]
MAAGKTAAAASGAWILFEDETRAHHEVVATILGSDLLTTLADIWQAAHRTIDTDGGAMLDHARAWCKARGQDPSRPATKLGTDPGSLTIATPLTILGAPVTPSAVTMYYGPGDGNSAGWTKAGSGLRVDVCR